MLQLGTGAKNYQSLQIRYYTALAEARAAEIREADIIFTTAVSCRRMVISEVLQQAGAPQFKQVIIDEAGQATEPEALSPMAFAAFAQQKLPFAQDEGTLIE